LVPSLVTLEATAIFERMLNDLWSNFLLPPAGSSIPKDAKAAASTPPPAAAAAAAAPPLTKRAHQEAAIKKWFEGLDMVALQLSGFKSGTANALRQQLMVQCLKRLDALLFHHLLLLPAPPQDVDDLLQVRVLHFVILVGFVWHFVILLSFFYFGWLCLTFCHLVGILKFWLALLDILSFCWPFVIMLAFCMLAFCRFG